MYKKYDTFILFADKSRTVMVTQRGTEYNLFVSSSSIYSRPISCKASPFSGNSFFLSFSFVCVGLCECVRQHTHVFIINLQVINTVELQLLIRVRLYTCCLITKCSVLLADILMHEFLDCVFDLPNHANSHWYFIYIYTRLCCGIILLP